MKRVAASKKVELMLLWLAPRAR